MTRAGQKEKQTRRGPIGAKKNCFRCHRHANCQFRFAAGGISAIQRGSIRPDYSKRAGHEMRKLRRPAHEMGQVKAALTAPTDTVSGIVSPSVCQSEPTSPILFRVCGDVTGAICVAHLKFANQKKRDEHGQSTRWKRQKSSREAKQRRRGEIFGAPRSEFCVGAVPYTPGNQRREEIEREQRWDVAARQAHSIPGVDGYVAQHEVRKMKLQFIAAASEGTGTVGSKTVDEPPRRSKSKTLNGALQRPRRVVAKTRREGAKMCQDESSMIGPEENGSYRCERCPTAADPKAQGPMRFCTSNHEVDMSGTADVEERPSKRRPVELREATRSAWSFTHRGKSTARIDASGGGSTTSEEDKNIEGCSWFSGDLDIFEVMLWTFRRGRTPSVRRDEVAAESKTT
ncbi:hypothetical protein C8R43DRAFT_962064 [Mycena crocata]|nr:hypothetical protein C8R43DRAFT_962064 [Mycena crocata]